MATRLLNGARALPTPAKAAVLLALFAAVPLFVENAYYIRVLNTILVYSMLSLGLNVILGFAGPFHFGQGAMFGLGAYTTAILTTRCGLDYSLAFLASMAVPALASLVLGVPSLRIRGDYLCLVTFAFGEIVRVVATSWVELTRGPMGIPAIPAPKLFGVEIQGNTAFYYYGLALTAVVYLGCHLVVQSHFGRAFLAIREDETAASAMGIDTGRYKILAFAISAIPAGIAGSYYASYLSFIGPTSFTADVSLTVVEAVLLGGMASLPGSIVGSAIVVGAIEFLRPIADFRKALTGMTILLILIFAPEGLMGSGGLVERAGAKVREAMIWRRASRSA